MNPNAHFEHRWMAWVAMAAAIAVLAVSSSVTAQRQAPAREARAEDRPAFEVATVKLAAPDAPVAARNREMRYGPNRLYIPNMTLSALIYQAYGDGGFNTSMRVEGGPDWVDRTAFAIEGVASGRATPRQLRLMLQTLLEERFALKIRTEMSSNDMLTLVLARSDGTLGPRVKIWNGTCPKVMPVLYLQALRRPLQIQPASETDDPAIAECPTGYRAGGISLDGVTMFTVAEILSLPPARALLGTLVSDQTGLKGRYTMELDYPFPPQRPADPAAPLDFGPPSLFTAIREQWGLGLVPGKGPFRLVVVERAQLPTAN